MARKRLLTVLFCLTVLLLAVPRQGLAGCWECITDSGGTYCDESPWISNWCSCFTHQKYDSSGHFIREWCSGHGVCSYGGVCPDDGGFPPLIRTDGPVTPLPGVETDLVEMIREDLASGDGSIEAIMDTRTGERASVLRLYGVLSILRDGRDPLAFLIRAGVPPRPIVARPDCSPPLVGNARQHEAFASCAYGVHRGSAPASPARAPQRL